ncbi:putative vancomycin resistance protein [Desulfosporosinus orientis DSM 765]|uniref:Putative vancomycin resistance protein n=1 Tax=Desulfosporosinus orientis (strain ATCC 19365 / DSM 765 / NCIMB 8382 / VKM B-1628 / Singapore I) TaxID=768706 RepID=G7W8E7_DESOD|nr:cell wall-binding repeat-containing protein [Desulfosporosinus orientis]AET67087.1 putative vancomycin resistance protein [Desulfosporosinus orientis DSM 765]
MNKKRIIPILFLCSSLLVGNPTFAAADEPNAVLHPQQLPSPVRLAGQTKFETSKAISEYSHQGTVNNVILATGNEFADALSASVLAYAKEAPILLVDSSAEKSKDAFDYVNQHLYSSGTVYIIGGEGIIGTEFEEKLNDQGYGNIIRIAGLDRYDTSYRIADVLDNMPVSTVVISSGEQYSDALSISSFAAGNGWPILLTTHEALPEVIKGYLLEKKPEKVYITGGIGVISLDVQSQIQNLLPQAHIQRLMGESRFDTNVLLAQTFAPNPSKVYLATGYGFADALAGTTVAAIDGNPIIFIDPTLGTLPKAAAHYFTELYANNLNPEILSFGGSGVVSDEMMNSAKELLSGTVGETSIYSIADVAVTVAQGQDFTLPTKVRAKLYNSVSIEVPVQWTPPKADTSKIGTYVFLGAVDGYNKAVKLNLTVKEPLPIAQYTTKFDPTLINRTENIRLAARVLDGKLLSPGERFSFNESVGQRTANAGYKEAMIIEGDVFTPGLGGGVCQVSSTLYNAVLLANLDIIERHPHSLPISYVPPGRDATVAYPSLDFKFKNNTTSRLLIHSIVSENTLTFQILKNEF